MLFITTETATPHNGCLSTGGHCLEVEELKPPLSPSPLHLSLYYCYHWVSGSELHTSCSQGVVPPYCKSGACNDVLNGAWQSQNQILHAKSLVPRLGTWRINTYLSTHWQEEHGMSLRRYQKTKANSNKINDARKGRAE